MSSITFSIAAIPCGAPNPRMAVFGGRLVRQTVPRDGKMRNEIRVVGMKNGAVHHGQREVAGRTAVGVKLEGKGARSARRRWNPTRYRDRYGCLLPVIRMSRCRG